MLENKGGVSVAQHGVARQIVDDQILRANLRQVGRGDQLVHLDHGRILGRAVEDADGVQQAARLAGMVVGTPVVIGDGLSLHPQQVGDHAGDGGFAVGAGDNDGERRLFDVAQEVAAQPHGGHARAVVAFVSGFPEQPQEEFPRPQGKPESQFFHDRCLLTADGRHRN